MRSKGEKRHSLKKVLNSWQLFGTKMLISKAWEKFAVDPYRFRGGITRNVPQFPVCTNLDTSQKSLENKRPLRICYLLHYFFPDKQGGTERFVLNLAKQQQKMGNTVCVITLGKRSIKEYPYHIGDILCKKLYIEGVTILQIRYRRAPRGLYYDEINPEDSKMAAFAKEFISQYRPDIVHFAYPQPFASFASACQEFGIPYIVTLTDFNMFCHYASLVKKNGMFCSGSCEGRNCSSCRTYGVKDAQKRFAAAQKMLVSAAYVTVPSYFVANIMAQEFPELHPCVIPHGIDKSFASVQMHTNTRRIIYVGTLTPLKGVAFLLRAFKKLRRNVSLEIYGGGLDGYVRSLKKIAKRDSRIIFQGEVPADKMPGIYQRADCIVVPSIWFETYNFVLREALASGCIAVASDIGAMPEAVRMGENGFLFEPGNEEALLAALEKACDFDWNKYACQEFPHIETEAADYAAIYGTASEIELRGDISGL